MGQWVALMAPTFPCSSAGEGGPTLLAALTAFVTPPPSPQISLVPPWWH